MSKYNFEIEPEEILLDKLAKKKEEEIGILTKKFEVPIFKTTPFRFLLLLFFLLFILYLRTFQLQIIKEKEFKVKAQANQFFVSKIKTERGVIYDQNFKQLVYNRPIFDLVLNKNDLSKEEKTKEKILKEVAKILNIDLGVLKEKINSSDEK
jgi:cell division protein FtsI/penicillin-binding protein 2